MKNLLVITLVFLIWTGNRALSQITQFPENEAVWREEHITFAGPVFKYYALCGDTVLSGQTYSQVLELQVDTAGEVAGSTFLGGLRSSGPQVRFYSDIESSEFLLYDFSLQPGNTINIYVPDLLDTISRLVDSVKTEFLAGANRRVIYFKQGTGGFDPEFWVEGIGSSYGLLGRGLDPIPDNVHSLLCYQHNNQYLSLTPETCNLPELTDCSVANNTKWTEKGLPLKLSVSPNPTSSRLKITANRADNLSNCNLKIYTANGKLLSVMEQVSQENTLPSEVSLSPGFYIAVLDMKQSGKVMAHCTFVVQAE